LHHGRQLLAACFTASALGLGDDLRFLPFDFFANLPVFRRLGRCQLAVS